MSEELENSLRQAVETYLNDRLRNINEQVARMQAELDSLRESSGQQNLEGTALSAAIFAHLQTARGQKLSGAAVASPMEHDATAIRRAVEAIEREQTQTDVLWALLKGAAQFTERAALFVIKNEQAIGWRVCKANDPERFDMIGGASLPLNSGTIVTRAAQSRSTEIVSAAPAGSDQLLLDQVGGNPVSMAAFPLIVRGKVVAILYADNSSDSSQVNADALEVLTRVASMAVNIISVPRAAVPAQREAAPAKSIEPPIPAPVPVPVPEVEPAYTPQVEPQITAPEPEPVPETIPEPAEPEVPVEVAAEAEAPVEDVAPEAPATIAYEAPVATIAYEAPVEMAAPEVEAETAEPEAAIEMVPPQAPAEVTASEVQPEPAQIEPPPPPPAAPAQPAAPFFSDYATPLGSSRRFGASEPELPIEVSEEERRLHSDARRFARLLVSEIKLYNEPKVKEGRSHGDLYDRLREDIDRSRQMYEKRVAPPVAARHDYFHQELVNTLAEGDPNKLGANYPGSLVGQ